MSLTLNCLGQRVVNLQDCPGLERDDAVAHLYQKQIFCGTGFSAGFFPLKDWWTYDIDQQSWERLVDAPFTPRQYVSSFQWKQFIYLFGGWESDTRFFNELWRFNCEDRSWEEMPALPGKNRWAAASVALNNRFYVGLGQDTSTFFSDWWEFNPAINLWQEKTSFPGKPRSKMVSSALSGQGLIGLGQNANSKLNDFWFYNTLDNSWKESPFTLEDSLSYTNYEVFQNQLILVSGESPQEVSKKTWIINFGNLQNPETTVLNTAGLATRGGSLIANGVGEFYLLWGLDSSYQRQSSLKSLSFDAALYAEKSEWNVFPNPATDEIVVQHFRLMDELVIMDLQGKKIGEYKMDSPDFQFINIEQYPAGIYLLYGIKNAERTQSFRLTKL